ncbi:GNAT family N-acetyltransferase [Microcoleus sp. FACHB-1515]|uniref:GNAT family N-acetyltransferase n=1 Tax=Cyanophyceae TaxID=3028117 RepID=UPI001686E536|nr:GNAT family N-acetyltransferase [Microcoleus sp. FACHB-1515]MBD2092291.1 GNAT family N-acetyltransferase [Microcoleus sp. FACHB-1515]
MYALQNLPLIFRMSPLASSELDRKLAELGLTQFDFTSVQIKDLSHYELATADCLQIYFDHSKWLDCFAQVFETSIVEQQLLTKILTSVVPVKAFAVLWKEDKPIAVGLAVLEGKDVGLFEIGTSKTYRRQGYARSLMLGLLNWAKQQGAATAYLQVVADNQPALKLYETLGFTELYQYFYRVQDLSF